MADIGFSNISASVRASNVFVELEGVKRTVGGDYMPPIGLIVGQYDQSKTGVIDNIPVQVTTADQVGNLAGFGSEAHRQAIWIFGILGGFYANMWWVPIAEPAGAVAGTGDIVFGSGPATSSGTFKISIGGDIFQVNVALGDTVTEIGDALVTAITAEIGSSVSAENVAGTVTITSKTKGVNANQIAIVNNPAGDSDLALNPSAVTVTVPGSGGYLTGGVGECDTTDIFGNLGDTWFTHISGPYNDATNIALYDAAGDARFDPSINRFFASYFGYVKESYTEALAVPATINSKWVNPVWEDRSFAPNWELQAAVMGIAIWSMVYDPGRPYKGLDTGIPVDTGEANRTYAQNDALFIAGMGYLKSSASGELTIGDLATSYRTNAQGATTSDWFDTVSTHRRQQKSYNVEQLFLSSPYDRGVVADDTTITGKSYVIKPTKVVADLMGMVDFWNSEGWTKNPAEMKASISANINSGNNSRIDAEFIDDAAQALRIIATKFNFYF